MRLINYTSVYKSRRTYTTTSRTIQIAIFLVPLLMMTTIRLFINNSIRFNIKPLSCRVSPNWTLFPSVQAKSTNSLSAHNTFGLRKHQSSLAFATTTPKSRQRDQQSNNYGEKDQHLVLVGGGHAHAQVIKALHKHARPSNLRITLIDRQYSGWYSGMVPGCIAGYYHPEETQIHLKPLAKWASMDFVHAYVVDIDFEKKLIYTRGIIENDNGSNTYVDNEPISFDVISLDIGSTSRDVDAIPGARKYTIPTRPIDKLVERVERVTNDTTKPEDIAATDLHRSNTPPHLVVVGGGVAGVELAMSVSSRWKKTCQNVACTLLCTNDQLLPDESEAARELILKIMGEKNIKVLYNCHVNKVKSNHVILKGGRSIPFTHCLWATGASAHDLAWHLHRHRGLAANEYGYFCVDSSLQSTSHPFVFAAGDCANIQGMSVPKAGVYAVRAGPILIENLIRYFKGEALQKYKPQDDFTKLIGCGDGKAVGLRFGLAFHGTWVWKMKNYIDTKFMNLFDVEKLPPPQNNSKYDNSQYDAEDTENAKKNRLDPASAAKLIQRQDDNVDFQKAWYVLRSMGDDDDYRDAVLSQIRTHANKYNATFAL